MTAGAGPLRFLTLVAICAVAACAELAGLDDTEPPPPNASSSGGPTTKQPAAGALQVTPLELVIPELRCGAPSSTKLTLRNDSDRAVDYEVTLPSASPFRFPDETTNAKGQVGPKATSELTINVNTSRPGNLGGEILVTTSEGIVHVKTTGVVKGAELTLTPSLVDFGEVRKDRDVPPQAVDVSNTGNEAFTLTGFAGATDDFTAPSQPVAIAPNTTVSVPITFVRKVVESPPLSAELVPRTDPQLCGTAAKLVVKGTRVNRDVLVNPVTHGFGDVDCLSQSSATRKIVVSNFGNQSIPVSVQLPGGSWFTTTPSGDFSVERAPPGGGGAPATKDIVIGLKPLGSQVGTHSEDIVINAGNPSVATKVRVEVRSVGAVIEISPTFLDVSSGARTFTVTNRGNRFVRVKHTSSTREFGIDYDNSYAAPDWFPATPRVSLVTTTPGDYATEIRSARGSPSFLDPPSGPICNADSLAVVRVNGRRENGDF